jgi:hypothetical protein
MGCVEICSAGLGQSHGIDPAVDVTVVMAGYFSMHNHFW